MPDNFLAPEVCPEAPVLTIDGVTFRDLNKNGVLDPYEDPRLPIEVRVTDLLSQMTLEEKAGLLFHTILPVGMDGELVNGPSFFGDTFTNRLIGEQRLNHFNVSQLPEPRLAVAWHNRLQKLAERTRLGIPVSISSDPRHAYTQNIGTGAVTDAFSRWPEPIGLAATWDEALIQQFGDIARQEYTAVGIRVALHPMADLATEPRWARINGTFGEDAQHSARMTRLHSRLPGRGNRPPQRGLHDQALPRRRPTEGWPRFTLRLRQRAGVPRQQL
jgi:beta-glucosidase